MNDLSGVVRVLKAEQDRLTKELRGITAALAAFGKTYTQGRPKRRLSRAGRTRIAAAQKARWAKARGEEKTPKLVPLRRKRLSSAARKKIAAAQKARWAKFRAAKKTG